MLTYTIFFIRKSDGKLLRRYTTTQLSKYFIKKKIEEQLRVLLDLYVDLERRDIIIREYQGREDNNE